MSINGISNKDPVFHPPGTSQQMGQRDFLRLMTAQLSQQDPFNPVDNQQMVAQMAEQLSAQTQLLKDIKAATPAPTPAT
jgi:flagellar basal-body rod modification protein FlgD